MNIEECFEIFHKYSQCFDTTKSDLKYLSSLDSREMASDDNYIYITPILNKMVAYSLPYKFFDIDYIKDLSANNLSFFDYTTELSIACIDYLNTIYDEKCIHPSVLRYDCLDQGVSTYDTLLNLFFDIRNLLEYEKNIQIFDDFNDNYLQKTFELDVRYEREMYHELNRKNDFKSFNKIISNYAFLYAMRKLLFAERDDIVTYLYNCDLHYGRILRKSGSDLSMGFIDLMIKLNEIKDSEQEVNCQFELKSFNDHYNYYNIYRNGYIRNSCCEKNILTYVNKSK